MTPKSAVILHSSLVPFNHGCSNLLDSGWLSTLKWIIRKQFPKWPSLNRDTGTFFLNQSIMIWQPWTWQRWGLPDSWDAFNSAFYFPDAKYLASFWCCSFQQQHCSLPQPYRCFLSGQTFHSTLLFPSDSHGKSDWKQPAVSMNIGSILNTELPWNFLHQINKYPALNLNSLAKSQNMGKI